MDFREMSPVPSGDEMLPQPESSTPPPPALPARIAPWNRPLLRDTVFWIVLGISLAVALFGFIPLLGLPGALIALTTVFVLGLGEAYDNSGDNAWGAFILLTLIVPPFLPVGYAVA